MIYDPIPGLVVQVVAGTPEDLRAGKAETAVDAEAAAEILNLKRSRFREQVQGGALKPCGRVHKKWFFLERDVLALKAKMNATA